MDLLTDKRVWKAFTRYFLSSAELAVAMPYRAWTLALAAVLAAICIWACRRGKLSFTQAAAWPCLGAWCALVLTSTVLARAAMKKAIYKLTPFWSYTAIASGKRNLLAEVVLNVVLFLPVGFLLPVIWEKARLRHAILVGAAFSALIEISQLLTRCGWFEFDDMIHNTLGTAIGYGLYRAGEKISELLTQERAKGTETQSELNVN